jgi:hypothetical protein
MFTSWFAQSSNCAPTDPLELEFEFELELELELFAGVLTPRMSPPFTCSSRQRARCSSNPQCSRNAVNAVAETQLPTARLRFSLLSLLLLLLLPLLLLPLLLLLPPLLLLLLPWPSRSLTV